MKEQRKVRNYLHLVIYIWEEPGACDSMEKMRKKDFLPLI